MSISGRQESFYTNLLLSCPYPASYQGGMRNGEQTFRSTQALLVSSVWSYSIVCCLRCVGYACVYGVRRPTFFQQKKKVGERGTTALAVQKCRSQAPRGLHSANRFCSIRHALACEESCKMDVGCETALRAVRDGMI